MYRPNDYFSTVYHVLYSCQLPKLQARNHSSLSPLRAFRGSSALAKRNSTVPGRNCKGHFSHRSYGCEYHNQRSANKIHPSEIPPQLTIQPSHDGWDILIIWCKWPIWMTLSLGIQRKCWPIWMMWKIKLEYSSTCSQGTTLIITLKYPA